MTDYRTRQQSQSVEELRADMEIQAKIIQNQQRKIEELSKQLVQTNEQYIGLKTAILQNPSNPQLAIQALHKNTELMNLEKAKRADEWAQRKEAERQAEADMKNAELRKQVLELNNGYLKREHEATISRINNEARTNKTHVENFFNLTQEQFSQFAEIQHSAAASPVRHIFTEEEYMKPGSTKKQVMYVCDLDNHTFTSVADIERHMFLNDDLHIHRDKALQSIESERVSALRDATSRLEYMVNKEITEQEQRKQKEQMAKANQREKKQKEDLAKNILLQEGTAPISDDKPLKTWPPKNKGLILG